MEVESTLAWWVKSLSRMYVLHWSMLGEIASMMLGPIRIQGSEIRTK